MHAPGPTNYHLQNHENALRYGANATEMDLASDAHNLMTGDYSIWARRAFRAYLDELPADRLERLGIDDVSTFDIQSYVRRLRREVNTGARSEAAAIGDPVVFEFLLMEHRRLLEYYQTYADRGHEAADALDSPLTTLGNQQSSIATSKSNAAIILSQAFDLIEMEELITVPGHRVNSRWMYLPGILTTLHKRAAAVSRAVDKPVLEQGFYKGGGRGGSLDPSRRYPTLMTLNVAEVYANGSTRQMDLDGWNSFPPDEVAVLWMDAESGSIPDDLRTLADFLWVHERDLRGTPRSDVAVVYSIPTMLARIRSFVGRRGIQEARRLDGWVRAARERQIPSDMVIFGHPELWDDADALARLSEYQTLVFPFAEALTDEQVQAVRAFVDDGGTAFVEGDLGTHDEYYRSRPGDLTDLDGVTVTAAGTPAASGDVAAAGDALENSLDAPLVEVDAPATVSCEVIETEDGWTSVHLVNYDYDADTDAITPVSDVDVALYDPDRLVQDVDLVAPGADPVSLTAERDGEYVTVTLPSVDVWGIVRFQTGTRTTDATESAARAAIDEAASALDDRSESGRSIPMARGKAGVYEATLAADAGQFDRAVERAKAAKAQAGPATKTLRIGIDSGHGQDPAATYDGLGDLREKYGPKYELSFTEITAFTPDQLAGLDGVLVGPAIQYEGQQYTFGDEELATLERFVDAGGRVAVVVRESVDDGINRLTERFEVTVDPRKIYTLDMWDEDSIRTEPAQYRTPLTYQVVEEGWLPRACSLTNLGADVSVHLQSKPNTVRGSGSEQRRYPVSVVSRRGEGAVVVHASDQVLSNLRFNVEVQARNILRFIGDTDASIAAEDLTPGAESSTTASDADTTSATSPAGSSEGPNATGTRTASPGFGSLSALAGLLGAVYALSKRRESGD